MKIQVLLTRLGGIIVTLTILLAAAYFIADDEKETLTDEVRSELPGQFVRLPGGVVHYELAGPENAPTVVLVHGFSVPYYVWDPTFKALVDAGFRVLRYDLYGRGYSDRPDAEYNLELFTTQLDQLLSALEVNEPVSLAGLSFGGPIVAGYANQHPKKIRSLSLFAPQVAPVSSAEIFPMNIPFIGEYFMGIYVAPLMLPRAQINDFHNPDLFPNWEDMYRDQMQYAGFRRAILSTIRNTVESNALAEYKSFSAQGIPIALFWGRQDQTISSTDIALIQEAIPDIEFHIVEEAGHLAHYERPEAVNPLLIEFLKNTKGQP